MTKKNELINKKIEYYNMQIEKLECKIIKLKNVKKKFDYIFILCMGITIWFGLMFEGLVAYASILAINFTGYILFKKIFEVKKNLND